MELLLHERLIEMRKPRRLVGHFFKENITKRILCLKEKIIANRAEITNSKFGNYIEYFNGMK